MSVTVRVSEIEPDEEDFIVCYSLDYKSADGATRLSVSYESRGPDEYEAAAEAIESGEYYFANGGPTNGEATFDVRADGTIEFEHNGYGNGNGGSLTVVLPAAPWAAAFRKIARVLRTGEAPEDQVAESTA